MASTDSSALKEFKNLCTILKCLGYTAKGSVSHNPQTCPADKMRTITIDCKASGMHVELEYAGGSCSCADKNIEVLQESAGCSSTQLDQELKKPSLQGRLLETERKRDTIFVLDSPEKVRVTSGEESPAGHYRSPTPQYSPEKTKDTDSDSSSGNRSPVISFPIRKKCAANKTFTVKPADNKPDSLEADTRTDNQPKERDAQYHLAYISILADDIKKNAELAAQKIIEEAIRRQFDTSKSSDASIVSGVEETPPSPTDIN